VGDGLLTVLEFQGPPGNHVSPLRGTTAGYDNLLEDCQLRFCDGEWFRPFDCWLVLLQAFWLRRGHCRLDYGIGIWVESKRIHGGVITVEDLNNSIEKKRQCSILLLG
jgi:hypothetical protein